MDERTRWALECSIKKWERILRGEISDRGHMNCRLCSIFLYQNMSDKYMCTGCPVAEKVQMRGCHGTPYYDFYHASPSGWAITPKAIEAAEEELNFLRSLRED